MAELKVVSVELRGLLTELVPPSLCIFNILECKLLLFFDLILPSSHSFELLHLLHCLTQDLVVDLS